jgi:hypothetical protein
MLVSEFYSKYACLSLASIAGVEAPVNIKEKNP